MTHQPSTSRQAATQTPNSAMDFDDCRDAMYTAIRAMPDGGIWADSYNHHVYAQHTLWYMMPNVIYAFHFNLMKHTTTTLTRQNVEIENLRKKSEPHLRHLKIKPCVTLQDAAQGLIHNAALPLTHFTQQSINLLENAQKEEIQQLNNGPIDIYSGNVFQYAINSLPNMREAFKAPTMNERTNYRFNTDWISVEKTQELEDKIKYVLGNGFPNNQTAQLAAHWFSALRLLWARKDCATDDLAANTAELMPHLDHLNATFNINTMPATHIPTSCFALETIEKYRNVLAQHPNAPHETFVFAFDYELTCDRHLKTTINKRSNVLHILERLPKGKKYRAGDLDLWCGGSNKKIVFPEINVTNTLIKALNA